VSKEWLSAQAEGRDPEGMPWQAEDVKIATTENLPA